MRSPDQIHADYLAAVRALTPRVASVDSRDAQAYHMVGFLSGELLSLAKRFPVVAADMDAAIPYIAKLAERPLKAEAV